VLVTEQGPTLAGVARRSLRVK